MVTGKVNEDLKAACNMSSDGVIGVEHNHEESGKERIRRTVERKVSSEKDCE